MQEAYLPNLSRGPKQKIRPSILKVSQLSKKIAINSFSEKEMMQTYQMIREDKNEALLL